MAPISIVGSEIFYGTFQSQKLGLTKALRLNQIKTQGHVSGITGSRAT